MIKLVVTDVDGTLVEDGSPNINPELFETILKLREKGIQFAVASGRPWASVERTFDPVKKKVFYIANNGSYIGCYGRSLYVYPIDRQIMKRLILAVRQIPGLSMVYAAADGDYTESKDEALCNWLVESYKFNLRRVDDLLEVAEDCTKLSIYKDSGVETAARSLVEEFKEILQISCAGDMWLDCMAKDVNKGHAVKVIQDSLGIKPEETMAFGDQLNDVEMLKHVQHGIAMGNGTKAAKEAADYITAPLHEDGIYKGLEHFGLIS